MKGKLVLVLFVIALLGILAFKGCSRIDAGNVGLKVHMVGGDRGVSKTEYVTGWVFYSRFTEKVFEFPVFQQHKEYEPFTVPSKGGTMFTVHPSFNYSIEAGHVADMFTTYRVGLEQLEDGYLKNAVTIAIREVTNNFTVDSMLNNLSIYDGAVLKKLNEKLEPFFLVSQFTTKLEPDEALKDIISKKAKTLQEAIQLENEQRKIKVQAENDIIGVKRDSAVAVIRAKGEAAAIHERQLALTPEYIEYQRVLKWDGKYPSTMLGSGSGALINLK